MSESFRDLIVWQKAMKLVTDIYKATAGFPARERYGLVNQLCRAAVAIPSDIAEGKGRLSRKEFVQMLSRARGSSFEVHEDLVEKTGEVGRLLSGLIKNLQKQIADVASQELDAKS